MYRRWIGAALALLLLLGAAGSVLALERLCVHYIDVGQGEAAFLAGPDFAVLIDAGDLDGTEVLDYLKALGVETIDLFVVTHPHADHIGQAAQVMRSFTVREVWMSGYEHYTRIFEELLDAVLESDADYFEPRRGDQRQLGGLTLQVLNPMEPTGSIHESCLVLRAVYGQVAFLYRRCGAPHRGGSGAPGPAPSGADSTAGPPWLPDLFLPGFPPGCRSRSGHLCGRSG